MMLSDWSMYLSVSSQKINERLLVPDITQYGTLLNVKFITKNKRSNKYLILI
jgi:hypothetical protein